MTKNVNELVLDAFFVEHREQLEQLRTLIASLQPGDKVADDPRIRDAFRLAHSFKGGARVCDLREAERLSHCLESLLEQLGHGQLAFSTSVATSITFNPRYHRRLDGRAGKRATPSRYHGHTQRNRTNAEWVGCSTICHRRSVQEAVAAIFSI